MNIKLCNKCKEVKNVSEFYADKSKRDGLHTNCKVCKQKRIDRIKEIKQEYYRLFGGCIVCGYNKSFHCIDFHHIDHNTKEYAISKLTDNAESKIRKELYKTIPLCRNCHGEHHAGVGQNTDYFIKIHEDKTRAWNLVYR